MLVALMILAIYAFIGIRALLQPQAVLFQTSSHFLFSHNNAPAPGSNLMWCATELRPTRLRNGEVRLATHCRKIGWLPMQVETGWPRQVAPAP